MYKHHNPIIAELRQARQARGISLAELERRAGWRRATIASHERGDRAVSLTRLLQWADHLDYELVLMPKGQPVRADVRLLMVLRDMAEQVVEQCDQLVIGGALTDTYATCVPIEIPTVELVDALPDGARE